LAKAEADWLPSSALVRPTWDSMAPFSLSDMIAVLYAVPH
jgi:hypothetical protein